MINFEAFFKISYGLYIVTSGDQAKGNGFISNTVFQVTSEPPQFATCCNKDNYTAELITNTGYFAVSVLQQNAPADIFGRFGYKSGRNINKFDERINLTYGTSGVPIVLNSAIAYLECKVVQTFDVGSHLMFIGEVVNSEILDNEVEPLTYTYYRQVRKGIAPKNAPTYIDKSKLEKNKQIQTFKKFKCPACGYIYDESKENIKFADLPDDWVCPACGSEKADFIEI